MWNKFVAALVVLIAVGCGSKPASIPKPRGFPKVVYPNREYVSFDNADCPFTFDYPDYLAIEKKTSFLGAAPDNPCWFDFASSTFNARIHCSYVPVSDDNPFEKLVNDAFRMANKINQRSNYMDEILVANDKGVGGLILEFKGPAASPMHFFLSDTTTHFLKASLYFNTEVRPDSLAPVTEFIKTDIANIINSFEWQ